jgi:hypothetical protein
MATGKSDRLSTGARNERIGHAPGRIALLPVPQSLTPLLFICVPHIYYQAAKITVAVRDLLTECFRAGAASSSASARVKTLTEIGMPNVYVEPKPKGRPEGSAITHFVLEYEHGVRVTNSNYRIQQAAIAEAKRLGHLPLIARVRNTSKVNPDHWGAVLYGASR